MSCFMRAILSPTFPSCQVLDKPLAYKPYDYLHQNSVLGADLVGGLEGAAARALLGLAPRALVGKPLARHLAADCPIALALPVQPITFGNSVKTDTCAFPR